MKIVVCLGCDVVVVAVVAAIIVVVVFVTAWFGPADGHVLEVVGEIWKLVMLLLLFCGGVLFARTLVGSEVDPEFTTVWAFDSRLC